MLPTFMRVLACSAAATMIATAGASAQGAMCASHEKITQALGGKFGEKRRAIGLISNSGLMELYVSETGTWTVILTNPDKLACILAAGHSWDEPPVPKELTGLVH